MATGMTEIDFGVFPGISEISVDVSGQSGLVATTLIETWIMPVATSDHSADEHRIERMKVIGQYKIDGTFTIYAFDDSSPAWKTHIRGCAQRQRLYGKYNIGWAWL